MCIFFCVAYMHIKSAAKLQKIFDIRKENHRFSIFEGDFCVSVISRSSLGRRSVETWMLHQGGRGYPVHRFPIAMRLRDRKGRAILCIALNPHYGDSSGAILGVRSVALLLGHRSVVSRW